ncbi:hypothetical protein C0J52_24657 [Blattella germanica]|nr:hypothetical protein C0J52_24657 [Blattella germanica]
MPPNNATEDLTDGDSGEENDVQNSNQSTRFTTDSRSRLCCSGVREDIQRYGVFLLVAVRHGSEFSYRARKQLLYFAIVGKLPVEISILILRS